VISFHSEDWKETLLSDEATIREVFLNLESTGAQISLISNKEGLLIGTISDGDIRRALLSGAPMDSRITQIMNRSPYTVRVEVPKTKITEIMLDEGFRQIPIVDESGKPIGVHLWQEISKVEPQSNTLVIMAGGRGSRLMPHTSDTPKPMLLVKGKPILLRIIERARNQGIRNIVISINYLGHVIKEYFENGEDFGVHISYLEEDGPLGTAGSLAMLKEQSHHPIVVTNGDLVSEINYVELLNFHTANQASATMCVKSLEWTQPYGVVEIDGLRVVNYQEKPTQLTLINAGIYVINNNYLDLIGSKEKIDMPEFLERIRLLDDRVIAFHINENWVDIGQIENLNQVNEAGNQ
jgi:dTDP-glucose pyrophosphorylase/predicted transcriptional regulator